MSGTNQSVKITLRNPVLKDDLLTYEINVFDNTIARDWYLALKQILSNGNLLEKNYCFLGFPDTVRNLDYLCTQLNISIGIINSFFDDYKITEDYQPARLHNGWNMNHDLMNTLHNHFEKLQGTVENLSPYYKRADYDTKFAIRQLNNLCHELENLMMSLRKQALEPDWVRSSQITTFLQCQRYELTDEHRKLFLTNGYDRLFGHVYMHWTQIGKTLFEVFRDEGAPTLTDTTCEAITHLQYYSGEFDVEWGNSVYSNGSCPWHDKEQEDFRKWLLFNNLDPNDSKLSLGYLPLGKIDLSIFGTDDPIKIRSILGNYLDIFKIRIDDVERIFNYCWTDVDYKELQINKLREGYDFSSRG
jgi:hypothetical protein